MKRRGIVPALATTVGLHVWGEVLIQNVWHRWAWAWMKVPWVSGNRAASPLLAPHVHVGQRIRVQYGSVFIGQVIVVAGAFPAFAKREPGRELKLGSVVWRETGY